MKICVYGAASSSIDPSYVKAVEGLGRCIAQSGHELVFGAGANGLMGAAARGVTSGGGKIHGVIPTFFKEEQIEEIYPLCDEYIYTETMRERKQHMEDLADAFIIAPGGIGTFEEFFEILTLKQLRRHDKPIIIFNVNGFYNELINTLRNAVDNGFIKSRCMELFCCTDSAEKAVALAAAPVASDLTVGDLKEG